VWILAASGCASIFGIEEQTFDVGDASDIDAAQGGHSGEQDDAHRDNDATTDDDGTTNDAHRAKDATADDDGTTADAHRGKDAIVDDDGTTLDVRSGEGSTADDDGTTADARGPVDSSVDASSTPDAATSESGSPDASETGHDGSTSDASAGSIVLPNCGTGTEGVTNCGLGGSGSESCCTSLEVTGGTPYYRTYTNDGSGPTGEADPAVVSSFRLDKYLVTVGRFRQFVAAWKAGYYPVAGSGRHTHLNGGLGLENSGDPGTYETGWDATDWNNTTYVDPTDGNLACESPWNTWTSTAGTQENLPITCANWWESYGFCIWDGGFLPSEAEWEYAAAGGSQQREYPWGSTNPATDAIQYAIYDCAYPNGSGVCAGISNIAPVGYPSLGAGYWNQLDLAGDVWEWNLDWYAPYSACTDCAYLATPSATLRVIRGGGFNATPDYLLSSHRFSNDPSLRLDGVIGFRCARTP
jgi:formylglycine-generating enzyme required for sulfatase activity